MKKTGAKLGDLKIKCVLKLEEGLKALRDQDGLKSRVKVVKIGSSSSSNQTI
jgi:hypothetical protein